MAALGVWFAFRCVPIKMTAAAEEESLARLRG
jgi:hypothetical protein